MRPGRAIALRVAYTHPTRKMMGATRAVLEISCRETATTVYARTATRAMDWMKPMMARETVRQVCFLTDASAAVALADERRGVDSVVVISATTVAGTSLTAVSPEKSLSLSLSASLF